jgi:hypothetical protein
MTVSPLEDVTQAVVFGLKEGRSVGKNWTWGLLLITLTIAIHATGIVLIAQAVVRIRVRIESYQKSLNLGYVLVIGVISVVGLLLAALHGIEAALWAVAYWWLGALDSLANAILYSVDSISTRGASGLMLEQHWRTMGAVEAMDGMLLFDISTAYIFAVMQTFWSLMTRSPW